jgi:tetratricopeptide (TPR) repeat protein
VSWGQSDPETEVARTRFKQGVSYYDQQEYEKARLAFLEAYALRPHPDVLLNLAQSELKAGHYADAATHLAQYIRENPGSEAGGRAQSALAEARANSVEVNVAVNQPQADLIVDGISRGQAPLPDPLYLSPGSHAIRAQQGEARVTQVMTAQAGQRIVVNLELPDFRLPTLPKAPAAETSPPKTSATVTADVPLVEKAPSTVGADQRRRPGFLTWLQDTPLASSALGVGALGLGTSAVLAGFSRNRYDGANNVSETIAEAKSDLLASGALLNNPDACGSRGIPGGAAVFAAGVDQPTQAQIVREYSSACGLFDDRKKSADQLKTLSLVSLGLGAGLVVGTIVAYFLDDGDSGEGEAAHRLVLTADIGPHTQAVSLGMAF